MRRILLSLGLAAAIFPLTSCRQFPSGARHHQVTVLVSIDGFRWDYLDKYAAPHLRRLAAKGVRAQRMTPSFPSKTFPNHYTLVTGLRPEHHGIVANWFYDPADNAKFDMGRHETRWWDAGEPIWVTAEKQGVRSACFFWPGSESEIRGWRPTLSRPFAKKMTNEDRVDGLLEWLGSPAGERVRLATLYFNTVDDIGHEFGPDAPETGAAVTAADAAIGRLVAGLDRLGLRDRTNFIILADHGMSPCGPDRVIFFEDLMDVSQVRIEASGPAGGVRPRDGNAAALAASIRAKAPPQLKVYLREEVPAHLHYRASDRIPPVVLICDDHWNIEEKIGWPNRAPTYSLGSHGWDPTTANMGALFVASGPAIRRGATIGDFENIHVYNLLCRLLGVKPAANDGDDRLAPLVLR